MLALGKSLSCLACVLLVIALAAPYPVQCAAEEKHNVNNNNNKNHAASGVVVVSTAAPSVAKVVNHLTTGLPLKHTTHAPAASVAPVVHNNDKSKSLAGVATSVVTTSAPIVAHHHPAAATVRPPVHSAASVAPIVANAKVAATILNAGHSTAAPAAAAAAAKSTVAPAKPTVAVPQRLAAYFEPICQQVDKLEPKQMFKIQAQMKQFIEKTAGKMSLCFMQHYSIDPNLTPINKVQLGTICSSRSLGIGVKSSFRNFQACAEQNWDKNLDAELERITRLCENCVTHPAAAPATTTAKAGNSLPKTAAVSAHDKENIKEATVISDVVGKVFANNQAALNKTDIKMIDVGPKASVGAAAGAALANAISGNGKFPSKEVLNDPNTMVVFVDEPVKTTTTKAPLGASAKLPAAIGVAANHAAVKSAPTGPATGAKAAAIAEPAKVTATVAPAAPALKHSSLGGLLTTLAPKPALTNASAPKTIIVVTTVKPAATVAKVVTVNKVVAKTTVAPAALGGLQPTKIAVAVGGRSGLGDKILSAVSTIEKLGKGSTTKKPSGGKSTTAKANAGKATTGAPKKGSTTGKPSAAPANAKASSTGKPNTTAKAKAASTSAAPKKGAAAASTKKPAAAATTAAPNGKSKGAAPAKGKDQADAKNAIKALQMQRAQQTHGGPSDAHLHQIEHLRQMAIDPIGHTIKHQLYEQRKAAAASGKKA